MRLWIATAVVVVALGVAGFRAWRRQTKAPTWALIASLGVTLTGLAWAWDADRSSRDRDAQIAAERAADDLYEAQLATYQLELEDYNQCHSRVQTREDLRGQFLNLFELFEVGFEGDEFVLGLVDLARSDLDADYPSYPAGTCATEPPTPPTQPTTGG